MIVIPCQRLGCCKPSRSRASGACFHPSLPSSSLPPQHLACAHRHGTRASPAFPCLPRLCLALALCWLPPELWAKSGPSGGTAAGSLGQVLPVESCLLAGSVGPSLSVGSPPAATAVTSGNSPWQCDAPAFLAASDSYSWPRNLPCLSSPLLSCFSTSPSLASLLLLPLAPSPSSHADRWPLCLMQQLARKWLLILLLLSSADSLFPLDIGAVKKDHGFLDQDSLKSLCR